MGVADGDRALPSENLRDDVLGEMALGGVLDHRLVIEARLCLHGPAVAIVFTNGGVGMRIGASRWIGADGRISCQQIVDNCRRHTASFFGVPASK